MSNKYTMDDGWTKEIKTQTAASKKKNAKVKSKEKVTDPKKRKAIIEAALKAATKEKKK